LYSYYSINPKKEDVYASKQIIYQDE
jgi:hypothetical protein